MRKLDFATYKDKVMGCWAGKNIGGVLGAPFEGKRQVNDISFYTQDLSMGPPPNDDLDLQIIWLAAVERYGRNVNASILGEYWLSYCIPNWVEYGTGKANLRAGLQPPLSGLIDNTYKDSCGCYIRSEIWACLAPGNPELAARYAYEDAIVDHEGEGMYGEIFFAALQSAAFVESDKRKLIDIALSYIPEESKTTAAIPKPWNAMTIMWNLRRRARRFIIRLQVPLGFRAERFRIFLRKEMKEWKSVLPVLMLRRMWRLPLPDGFMEKRILERASAWRWPAERTRTVPVPPWELFLELSPVRQGFLKNGRRLWMTR